MEYRPENEILVTVGVSEALDLAFRALVNPGDKVMFHQPCYVSYHPSVTLTHGVGVPVPTYARDSFALTAKALAAAWQPGCKLLMLNLPCNPDGRHVQPGAARRRSPGSASRRICSSSATRSTPS